ncbi:MAG: hypothetical protein GXP08_17420 [Gammaproteobacteria bacterium]|nr:hypothetical protein [Gammaproteobacteria bacterium]
MYLKKFVYVNWGNIPNLEFEFGPVNLLSGGNGSGKTTAADAIQTIMTAAHENLFQYNPGQEETTQRGRGGKRVRTLASYVLGCDDGSYARLDPVDGYLAAIFYPTQGETGEPFSAVIGVRAWLDKTANQLTARQEPTLFLILPNTELHLSDFVYETNSSKQIVALDRLQTDFVKKFGPRQVEKYDTKKSYLRRLYAIFRGQNAAVTEREALSAARAFSRFMAYKPVQSINKFVAEEILEKKDLGDAIRSISGQLKTINAMDRDACQLKESIHLLQNTNYQTNAYIEKWIERNVFDYILAQYHYQDQQQTYINIKKAQKGFKQAIEDNDEQSKLTRQRRQQVHDQLVSLEAQRIGIPALQQKDNLEQQRDSEVSLLREQTKQLLLQDNQINVNFSLTKEVHTLLKNSGLASDFPALTDLNSQALCRQLIEQGGRGDIDLPALLGRDILGDLTPLEDYLDKARLAQNSHNQWVEHWHNPDNDGTAQSLRDQLARLAHQRETRYEQLENGYKQKQREIERLESHKINYPPHVERAISAIKAQCPQADPRILCDYVDVKEPKWQSAIEGYLGGARFSIMVEADSEAEAIRIVRKMAGKDNKARIIQGEKARRDAERLTLDPNSVIHVMDFTHATAKHYLMASYGSVVRVESADALCKTRRGLTAEGMGCGNYSMWRCDLPDSELVFGDTARERALRAKQEELAKLTHDWQQANDQMQVTSQLLSSVNGLKNVHYADTITNMLAIHRDLQKVEAMLQQLDLSAHEELEQKLNNLKVSDLSLGEQEGVLKEEKGTLQEKLNQVNKRCKTLDEGQAEAQQTVDICEENLRAISKHWAGFDCEMRLDLAEKEAGDLNPDVTKNCREEVNKQLSTTERKISDSLQVYNQTSRPGNTLQYSSFEGEYDQRLFKHICELQGDIDRVYNLLKNNVLVEKQQQLSQLKQSVDHAFVTHLCHSIYQAINDGKRQIKLLNKELQHHKFGSDRETFRFDQKPIPEFKDYEHFFAEVMKNPTLGDEVTLFEANLSDKSQKIREQLMAMLLDEDEQKSQRELERIADYRNYYQYEIYKEVDGKLPIALSEYGTGSGGQLETPAYIIRSAAITSAFRFAEGLNHLRVVLVDEAFSKMDEMRSREVIDYLTNSLGLQLIFIMPTSKCGPFMDLISNEFIFAKCPSDSPRGQLNTRVIVDRKRCNTEKIKALWANHRRTVYQQAELDFMKEI